MEHTTLPIEAGTFHALSTAPGRGASRPLLFLHGFPDHPPTAKPFFWSAVHASAACQMQVRSLSY